MDIHNYEKQYESALDQVRGAQISAKNKELILRFNEALVLENISKPRLVKYLNTLKIVAERISKDFDETSIEDVKSFISKIQQSNLSPWTKQGYKVIIRRFYKWIKGTEEYPDIVKWINIGISRCEKRLPSEGELLTEDDVQKLVRLSDHPRDKAFVSVLWESGARVSEIGNLCIRNVSFDKYGVVISVKGKTGSRKIRMISSTPYLSTWINSHPFREDNNSPLWVNIGQTNHNKVMCYGAIRKLLENLFKKVGIKKRFNPHIFRHSRATYMANHLTEFQMNQYFGWIQGSDMPSTYVHMSGREVDDAVLAMNGIKNEEKKDESKLLPRICSRCDTINSNEFKHCSKCGGILDLKYAMELEERKEQQEKLRANSDQMMNMLMQDKEVQAFLMEKLKGIGLNHTV